MTSTYNRWNIPQSGESGRICHPHPIHPNPHHQTSPARPSSWVSRGWSIDRTAFLESSYGRQHPKRHRPSALVGLERLPGRRSADAAGLNPPPGAVKIRRDPALGNLAVNAPRKASRVFISVSPVRRSLGTSGRTRTSRTPWEATFAWNRLSNVPRSFCRQRSRHDLLPRHAEVRPLGRDRLGACPRLHRPTALL